MGHLSRKAWKETAPRLLDLRAAAVAALVALAASGVLLALAYDARADHAHASVWLIGTGPLASVRSLHFWSASAALILALVLTVRAWLAGDGARTGAVLLLLLSLGLFGFLSGSILAWDEHGWQSAQHLVGGFASFGMEVDVRPSSFPLSLVFVLHALVPAFAVLLVAPPLFRALRSRHRFTLLARRSSRLALRSFLMALVGLGAAALLFRLPLGPAPGAGIQQGKPEWPFLWLLPLEDALGELALLLLPASMALMGLAFLARPRRTVRTWIALACSVILGVLALVGLLS